MGHGSRKLTIVAALMVLLTLTTILWRLAPGGATESDEQWQASHDAERLRMQLTNWINWLQQMPPDKLAEALGRHFDETVQPAERPPLIRQTLQVLADLNNASPHEVTRYRGGEIIRATWATRDGGSVTLLFRCPSGETPKLLRTSM